MTHSQNNEPEKKKLIHQNLQTCIQSLTLTLNFNPVNHKIFKV